MHMTAPVYGDRVETRSSKCPVSAHYQKISEHCPVLASTGCTKQFCQAGRAIHTDENRVGENRSLDVVEREAEEFLREFHRENPFQTDEQFQARLDDAIHQIRSSAITAVIRRDRSTGLVGGNYTQTSREIEFGIRRAWRNARKCIMRSHSDELRSASACTPAGQLR